MKLNSKHIAKSRIILAIIIIGTIGLTGSLWLVFTKAATATITINDNTVGSGNLQWQYVGSNWAYYNDGGNKYEGDDHSSSATGDYAVIRFDGTKIEYYGAKSPQAGIVAISIDNGAETMVDLYSATRQDNTVLFTSPVMADGDHTLKIRLTGTKNPSANASAAAIDRAVVTVNAANATRRAVEAEASSFSAGDMLITDTSASGGSAVQFKAAQGGGSTSGTTSSTPMAYPARAVDLYHMMWLESGSPLLSTTPTNVNVVRLAFAQGDPPSLVGWGSQSEASFISDAKALRARGVRIILSLGGASGGFNTSNRQGVVNGIMAINSKLPLDGIDWDLEGPAMHATDVVWIAQELDRLRGANFAQTMAPNGGNVDEYLPVAKALQDAGLLDAYGQQFYDSEVSKEAALGRINQAISYGIPQNKIQEGMMIADGAKWWTVQECIDNYTWLKQQRPSLKGAYLWEAGRPGTAEWASRFAPLVYQ